MISSRIFNKFKFLSYYSIRPKKVNHFLIVSIIKYNNISRIFPAVFTFPGGVANKLRKMQLQMQRSQKNALFAQLCKILKISPTFINNISITLMFESVIILHI